MEIDLRDIQEEDMILYNSWIKELEKENYMSRFQPRNSMEHHTVKSEDFMWEIIELRNRHEVKMKEAIGSVWLERKKEDEGRYILGIFIADEKDRGKGIGKKVIGLMEKEGKERFKRMEAIQLDVRVKNERAIECYKKSGFVVIGHGTNERRNNESIEYYVMEKACV